MRLLFTISLCLALILSTKTYAQINVQDSLALVVFYNSTNGASWVNNTNWLTAAPVSSWHGVTTKNNRVDTLTLSNNGLSGTIPPELGNLINLQYLNLDGDYIMIGNRISGSIPSELGNLINLQYLSLRYNRLTGSIPSKLGNLINLQSLILSYNYLSGSIPSKLGNLINLQYLSLDSNRLSGSIPGEFGNLANLQGLILNNNQLDGSIPPEFGNLKELQELNLGDNQLSGSIPPEFGNLKNLKYDFSLYNNQLSGSIPPELGNFRKLQYLNIDDNQLTGSIPPEFGKLKSLQLLFLNHNRLSGSIPPEFGNLAKLFYCGLSHNRLSGSIPSELGNLTNLQKLYLNNNQLSGSIPPEFLNRNLAKLNYLYLNNNQLSGSIPPEFENVSNLTYLYLNNNQLSGSIPPELGSLRLTALNLSYNNLSGNIPSELGNLSFLRKLFLNDNNLSGIIPSELLNRITKLSFDFETFWVQGNQLTFNGMEPFAEKSSDPLFHFSFTYAPQAIIPLHNNGNILSVSAGGTLSNNTYKWYKNYMLYKILKGDSTLTITGTGKYFAEVTNDIAVDLTLHSDTINFDILPVSLLSFTAQKQNNTSLLQWQTTNEINNSYFDIERSSNSKIFSSIGTKPGLNNDGINNYSFTDNTPLKGINYYRLKQVDNDGKFSYSGITSVEFLNHGSVFAIAPNPANNFINVIIPSSKDVSEIIIYDVSGKKILHEQIAANITSKQININQLTAGVYNVVLMQNGKKQMIKFIKK